MNRLFVFASACALCLAAHAEGYQVNTFSARQSGMGHTGVAQVLGAESTIFNPGALTFMDKTLEISGSVSAISSKASAWHSGTEYKSDNKTSTPMNVSAAFRIYDNLYAGVSFFTPYGSSINWGYNWPGSVLNQAVELKVMTVQPTISWKITPKLSIGAGFMVSWGSVDLNKGLVSTSSLNQLIKLQTAATVLSQGGGMEQVSAALGAASQFPEHVSPASANLTGTAETTVGFNFGAFYEVNDKWAVGASLRTKMDMHVKAGDVSVKYADKTAEALLENSLKNLSYTNFEASMPCPYVLIAGVSYKPIKNLQLALDVQLNGWKAYKQLDIEFAEQEAFNQHIEKSYKNAMTYHLGAQYSLTDRLDLRAGLMVDTSPCRKDHYNPETPATTKIEPACGLSFRPIKGLSIDLSFMYVNGVKVKDASGEYADFIAEKVYNPGVQKLDAMVQPFGLSAAALGFSQLPNTGTFKADYKVTALIPAIGVSYAF